MKKSLLLLSVTFVMVVVNVSHAQLKSQCSRDDNCFQILLKKWQESADWQELGPIDSVMQSTFTLGDNFTELYEIMRKIVKEYYGVDLRHGIGKSRRGEQREYLMVSIRGLLRENEEVKFLLSRINGQVLATHQEIARPNTPAEDSIQLADELRRDANMFDRILLREWESKQRQERGFLWWLRGLVTLNCAPRQNNPVDSVTAVAIAVAEAERHYASEMTSFGARLMGDDNEHWMVYCYPAIQRPRDTFCYTMMSNLCKNGGMWRATLSRNFGTMYSACPGLIIVLISRKDGQVLMVYNHGSI